MAVKRESTFHTSVNKHVPRDVYRMKNNNPFVAGVPDVWYSGNLSDLWVEFKWLPRTPQRGSVLPVKLLSELQAQWLLDRHSEGRKVAVIIGCPDGGVVLPGDTWKREISVKEFSDLVQSRPALAQWITSQVQTKTR